MNELESIEHLSIERVLVIMFLLEYFIWKLLLLLLLLVVYEPFICTFNLNQALRHGLNEVHVNASYRPPKYYYISSIICLCNHFCVGTIGLSHRIRRSYLQMHTHTYTSTFHVYIENPAQKFNASFMLLSGRPTTYGRRRRRDT